MSLPRIVSGRWGGRTIVAPSGTQTRPTSERTREALFSMLLAQGRVAHERVLDLCCGSAALALESLSRGAVAAVAVDRSAAALAAARRNGQSLGATTLELVNADVVTFLSRPPVEPFDVVFCDPPYDHPAEWVSAVLERLAAPGWLGSDGVVVLEQSRRAQAPHFPTNFIDVSSRQYGETLLWFGYRAEYPDAASDETHGEELA